MCKLRKLSCLNKCDTFGQHCLISRPGKIGNVAQGTTQQSCGLTLTSALKNRSYIQSVIKWKLYPSCRLSAIDCRSLSVAWTAPTEKKTQQLLRSHLWQSESHQYQSEKWSARCQVTRQGDDRSNTKDFAIIISKVGGKLWRREGYIY